MLKKLSPIVLFAYNRPGITEKTLKYLEKNDLANKSELIVFCDAPKSKIDNHQVNLTIKVIEKNWNFKSVKIIKRNKNLGLLENISTGVSEVIESHDTVIVLEDDLETSKNFLTFMNSALNYFKSSKEVFHISGYNLPHFKSEKQEIICTHLPFSWGWATWKEQWKKFNISTNSLIKEASLIENMNLFNYEYQGDFLYQLQRNIRGDLQSWAIRWYIHIYNKQGLCVSPSRSLVGNRGFTKEATNCEPHWWTRKYQLQKVNNELPEFSTSKIAFNPDAYLQHVNFYRRIAVPTFIDKVKLKLGLH